MGCLTTSTQAWAAEYFRGLPTARADVRAVELLRQCRRPGSWEGNTDLKESISHFYVEQENGVPLEELGRGSFGENSFFDFNAIEFFQIDADGSKALIEDWVDDHLVDVRITYDMAVQSVRCSTGKNVKTVATRRDGSCTQKYRSKYVIPTPSLNVLRSNINWFEPRAPIEAALDKHPITNTMVRVDVYRGVWSLDCIEMTNDWQLSDRDQGAVVRSGEGPMAIMIITCRPFWNVLVVTSGRCCVAFFELKIYRKKLIPGF